MKTNVLLIATVALALTACGAGGGNAAADSNTAAAAENATAGANEAAPAPATENATAPATAAAGAAPTRDYVVGKWGEDGDCTLAIEFRADGSTDGPFGNWNLEGNQLSMADSPQVMTVTVVDQNTMESVRDGDRPRRLTRC
jgi:hypothetical protein